MTRLLVFSAIVLVPRRVYTLGVAQWGDGLGTVLSIGTVIQLASIPVLFLTARAKNGYRGLHELLSGTAVVLLPAALRRRSRAGASVAVHEPARLARPEGMPRGVGPYRVAGALAWEPSRRVLLAEDVGLGRAVWVVLRPAGAEPTCDARREVGRLARPRWLGAGEADGWCWDAYVAPGGLPLPELVGRRGRLAWHEARVLLEDLAAELAAACDDGTLPEPMSPDRVWVQHDGRVFLIDAPLDPRPWDPEDEASKKAEDPQRRALGLLRGVAYCALGGDVRDGEGAVGAPVPGHALEVVERLCGDGEPYPTVADFLADLETTREKPPELTDGAKFAHAAYTLVSTAGKTWFFPLLIVVYYLLIAYMAGVKGPIEVESEVIDRIFLAQSTLWVLLAILLREGLGGLLLGTTIVRSDGRRASRLRLAWREALRWLPVLAIDSLIELVQAPGADPPFLEFGLLLAMPILYVAPAMFVRGRYLNDLMAGTAVMPR